MIRIERGSEVRPGVFEWTVAGWPDLKGASRQPLLDACRALCAAGAPTEHGAGVFRPGRTEPDLFTKRVDISATLTVSESDRMRPRFAKWRPFDPVILEGS